MVEAHELKVDRRDGLRRRIYLACLIAGIPTLLSVWAVKRGTDPFIALAYPLYGLSQVVVLVGLLRQRMDVRHAERIVLVGTVATYLSALAFGVFTADGLAQLRQQTTLSSILTINLMPMLAYVAFETRHALRVSLAIVGAYVAIVAVGLVPEVVAGRLGADGVDYLAVIVFLFTSVGLLHVMAQVREQAVEARMNASAMEMLANTDVLTGIPNRRRLHDVLEARVARSAAESGTLAIILIDLDHFKLVNDTHGHDVGDAVLRHVASTLTGAVGDVDIVGRWGGEEFLVIAPSTTVHRANALAEVCRGALSATDVPVVGRITASLGVATNRPGDTAWTLLRRADDALYVAKGAGRDQVHDDRPECAETRPSSLETVEVGRRHL